MPPARRWFHQPRFVAPPSRNFWRGPLQCNQRTMRQNGHQALPGVSATVFIGISRHNSMTIAFKRGFEGLFFVLGHLHARHPLCALRARLKIDSRALTVYKTRSKQIKSY